VKIRRSMPPRKPRAEIAKPQAKAFRANGEKMPPPTFIEITAIESKAVRMDQPKETSAKNRTPRNGELAKNFSANVTTKRIEPELKVVRCFK